MLDSLIIGAGPGGLTTAIYLARYRRNIRLLGTGPSRAELIPSTHNFPGFPAGISGSHLLARLSEQAAVHGIESEKMRAEAIRIVGDGFEVEAGGEVIATRTIVLATGVVDQHPDVPGLREATLAGVVRWCPICDGYEVLDQSVAILGPAISGMRHAKFLRTYTRDLCLLALPDSPGASPEQVAELEEAGIELEIDPVVAFAGDTEAGHVVVRLASGRERRFDVIYPMVGCSVQGELARSLGAKCTDQQDLIVDDHQETSVAGLFAVGDVVSDLNQISVATGHAAVASTAIHNRLPPNYR